MLKLARTVKSASRFPPLASRSFAEVVNATPSNEVSASAPPAVRRPKSLLKPTNTSQNVLINGRIPVREDHGLYAFFRMKEVKEGDSVVGDARYEVAETPENIQKVTGEWFLSLSPSHTRKTA